MRKLISAAAVCAVAVGLVAVPGALAVKSPKLVTGTVSVGETPNPLPDATLTVGVSGNLASNSTCRKDRTVRFQWVIGANPAVDAVPSSTTTRSNGNYAATLARPPATSSTASSAILRVTVDQVTRKVGGRKKHRRNKKGRQFDCLAIGPVDNAVSLVP